MKNKNVIKKRKSTIDSCYDRFLENVRTVIFSLRLILVGVIALDTISSLCNLNDPATITLQNTNLTWIVVSVLTLVVSGLCCSAIPSRNS